MPSDSDWVLYGINGFDPGLMHNAIYHWSFFNCRRYDDEPNSSDELSRTVLSFGFTKVG